jgi:hypothetical protein
LSSFMSRYRLADQRVPVTLPPTFIQFEGNHAVSPAA